MPLVQVIVIVDQPAPFLSEAVASVTGQSMSSAAQVLLANFSDDDEVTAAADALVRADASVEHFRLPKSERRYLLRWAVETSVADFLLFLDPGDTLPQGALQHLHSAIAGTGAPVAIGSVMRPPGSRRSRWERLLTQGKPVTSIQGRALLSRSMDLGTKMFRRSYLRDHIMACRNELSEELAVVSALIDAPMIATTPKYVRCIRRQLAAPKTPIDRIWQAPSDSILSFVQSLTDWSVSLDFDKRFVATYIIGLSVSGQFKYGQNDPYANDIAFAKALRDALLRNERDAMITGLDGKFERVALLAFLGAHQSTCTVRDAIAAAETESRVAVLRAGRGQKEVNGIYIEPPYMSVLGWPAFRLAKKYANIDAIRSDHATGEIEFAISMPVETFPSVGFTARGVRLEITANRLPITRLSVAKRWIQEGRYSYAHFTGRCRANELPEGARVLYVKISVNGQDLSLPLRSTKGFARQCRELNIGGSIVLARPLRDARVVMEVARRTSRRLRYRVRRAARTARAIVRREPLSGPLAVRMLTLPFARMSKPIILFAERTGGKQDNGWAQFNYQRSSSTARSFYLVKGRSSLRKGLIRHGSLVHRLLYLHARALVSSHDIDAYMLPPQWDREDYLAQLAWRIGAHRIWLQHGVTMNSYGPAQEIGTTGLDCIVASTRQEKRFLSDSTGYSQKQVLHVGLPRFDLLIRGATSRRETILIAPTWRKYLVAPSYSRNSRDPGTFTGSRYERFYVELLKSEALADVARRHGVRVVFLPHFQVAQSFTASLAGHSQIEVVSDGGAAFRERLLEAAVCVSDYSSVVFDAAFAGIPVIHIPFDEDDFYGAHLQRGWFDIRREELGPVARDIPDIVSYVDKALTQPISADETRKRRDEIFGFEIGQSRAKVASAIETVIRGEYVQF